MKVTKFANLVVLGLVLTVAVAGCRKKPSYLTPLPGSRTGLPQDVGAGGTVGGGGEGTGGAGGGITSSPGDTPQATPDSHLGWIEDASIFKQDTVYFDFDSSVVKTSEKAKVSKIAEHLKANARTAVRVEGNCDERGTEEYNRALGERRALAVREELIALGIDPKRVDTVSYGEDKPAAQGHDESAWKLNRRDDFILLTPP